MLTESELAQLRIDVLALLPDVCDVQRATNSVDAAGDVSQTWATVATGVVCRLDPLTRQDGAGMVAEREATRAAFVLTVAHDATIELGDRLVLNGKTYEMTMLHATHSLRAVKRLTVILIQGA
jgi:hypothetical protein